MCIAARVVVTRESNRPTRSFKTTFSHSDVGYPNTIARCVPRRCVRESVVVGRQTESDNTFKIDPKLFDQIVYLFLLKLASCCRQFAETLRAWRKYVVFDESSLQK